MNQSLPIPTAARVAVAAIGAVTLAFVLYARKQDRDIERDLMAMREDVEKRNANFNDLLNSLR